MGGQPSSMLVNPINQYQTNQNQNQNIPIAVPINGNQKNQNQTNSINSINSINAIRKNIFYYKNLSDQDKLELANQLIENECKQTVFEKSYLGRNYYSAQFKHGANLPNKTHIEILFTCEDIYQLYNLTKLQYVIIHPNGINKYTGIFISQGK